MKTVGAGTLLEGGLGYSQVKQRCFSWNWWAELWVFGDE